KYDTPVLIRTTTRMAHSRGIVTISERKEVENREVVRDMRKNVMLPVNARMRHVVVEERENTMADDANELPINRIEWTDDRSLGVVASGIAYQYVKEAMPEIPVLKLGMVNPLPLDLIRSFADGVQRLVIAEELEPIYEEQIKALGIECEGKGLFSRQGEFSTPIVKAALTGEKMDSAPIADLPARPPVMCPGCPHRATFNVLSKLGVFVSGDIGCYTLGALPPANAMHVSVCMGSSIPVASGMQKADPANAKKTVSVIGDSTFFHSGMTGLVDMVYNKANGTVLILDNGTTGMTGHQDHPGTGKTLDGEYAPKVDFEQLVRALGVTSVNVVDPFDMKLLEKTIREELEKDEPSVIICRRPCALLPGMRKAPVAVDPDVCKSCGLCLKLGCPAIENHDGHPVINQSLCTGCGLCASICPFHAIKEA
ncbi:MAG: indolepyruvate ferredoxin oxidoreductase subunit alpha, partial [Clostridia bacterium]|nr:indolepyruvate ferredoxin oxidoreductase subunit alpha [Clostridia bacterium]